MGHLDRLYARLPVWGQHASVSAYGLYWYWVRYGPGFSRHVEDYRQREENFTHRDWKAWQNQRLSEVLTLALEKVPLYQALWMRSEKAAVRAGVLADLPFLEKDLVRADPRRLIRADATHQRLLAFHTSGTTGTPIVSYWTVSELRESHAFHEVRGSNAAGVSFFLPRSTLSGRLVEPNPESHGPYYRYNLVERQVYFSPFHLSAKTAGSYMEALRRHRVQWMTGYAVSHFLLAQFILEQGLEPPPLRAIITTSEKVTPDMKDVMHKAFRCPVFEEYNNVENVFFANDCEHGHLHVSPEVGIIEILRPDGTPCDPGEVGEVVATCLFRTYQPFIRYRIGDLAAWDPEPCPCGRQMPVIKEVVGRIEDVVLGLDGRQLVRFHGIFVNQRHIKQGQIIQETLDRIRVKVVPAPGFGPADMADVVARIQTRLGPMVQVTVEPVEQIPLTSSGKFQAVVSLLKDRNALKATHKGSFQND